MKVVRACSNFIILLVEKYNGLLWYIVLFYGSSSLSMRSSVLMDLEAWCGTSRYPFLIVGDFNQVEYGCDKLSSGQRPFGGAYEFNMWKIKNELVDIPFKGPRFTWCNNRKGDKRVYERIDKALGSTEWSESKKPYKIDAWVLDHEECLERIRNVWAISENGSPTYRITRKLSRVRTSVKKWTLDKKAEWKVKWEEFDQRLEEGMNIACMGGSDEAYSRANDDIRNYAKAVASFWKQRAKLRWMVDGDTCTKYFFNWVKGRAWRNFIHGIKYEDRQ
ncbi:uncharacterized protein LOC141630746 [Silene latifolia]|uniref:uncharacterized protein LOC141630746 n=1 Tax=Silene latifolia TaxID=37657 RepID=UPI003D78B058